MTARSSRGLCLLVTAVLTLTTAIGGLALVAQGDAVAAAAPPTSTHPSTIAFEENRGQADASVAFLSHLPDGTDLFFTPKEVVTVARDGSQVRVQFEGAQPTAQLVGEGRLAGVVNDYRGADPARWVSGASRYARVVYESLWPGVDLAFYGNAEGKVEYDFVVAPGGDPAAARLHFIGADVTLATDGALVAHAGSLVLRQPTPRAYQEIGGRTSAVASAYVLLGAGRVALRVGDYDPGVRLVVDPVMLTYGTYLGGSNDDGAGSTAVDANGNVYVIGSTLSTNFPTQGATQSANAGGWDVFLSKFGPQGNLLFSTYLGGSGDDFGAGVAVDANGNALLRGVTTSSDFPILNAFQTTNKGGGDFFVAKLSGTGSLAWSTYFGGVGTEEGGGAGIAVDASGNAYVTGHTFSYTSFPTLNADQPLPGAGGSAETIVAKFTSAGGLVWSTFLGGSSQDYSGGLALDPTGGVYVIGQTASSDFPVKNPYQATRAGGFDVFVAKYTSAGSKVYATYLGGTADDVSGGIAADANGDAYVGGQTASTNFPLANALQPTRGGGTIDAFVAKLSPQGNALIFSTYLGGSGNEGARSVALDASADVYVAGETTSSDFPTLTTDYAPSRAGGFDAFVTEFTPSGSALLTSTYLGGSGTDKSGAVAVDASGKIYVAGLTTSGAFPTTPGSFAPTPRGSQDAFLAVLTPCAVPVTTAGAPSGVAGNGGWWRSAVTVAFSVTSVCPATTYASIDGGPFVAVAGSLTLAADGVHTVAYRSVDRAGLTESARTLTIRIDTTPPTTTAALSGTLGGSGWWRSAVDVTLTATDATSGVAVTHYRVDGGTLRDGTSFRVSGDGNHTIEFGSEDAAGNVEPMASQVIRIDTTPPTVAITDPKPGHVYVDDVEAPPPMPEGGSTVIVGDKTVRANASDSMSGMDRVEFWVDGSFRNESTQAPYEFLFSAGLESPGQHTIETRAFDVAGNEAASAMNVTTLPLPPDVVCRDLPPVIETIRTPVAGIVGLLGQIIPMPDEVHRIVKSLGVVCDPRTGHGGSGTCGDPVVATDVLNVRFGHSESVNPAGIAHAQACATADSPAGAVVQADARFDYVYDRSCSAPVGYRVAIGSVVFRDRYTVDC